MPEGDHRFPCAACGADMRYAPGADRLICDHCGAEAPVEGHARPEHAIEELDFEAALKDLLPGIETEETRTVRCDSCGAEVEFDEKVHAKECPFCATPFVTGTGTHRQIKPKAVLPFALDERTARKAVGDWLGRLWFAPNGLAEYARKGRAMNGMYVPFWTFDADTRSRYSGQRGDAYYVTRTRMVNGKRQSYQERKIRWSPRKGRVARFFDDILVIASTSLPVRLTSGFSNWDLSGLEPYRPEFLAGFRAEGYTVPLAKGYDSARAHMDRVIERDVRFDIGGDAQQIHRIDTAVSDVTFKHVLLPIWIAAYKYRGETYRLIVNGRTGQVTGERPYSAWKIAVAVLIGALAAAAIGYGIAVSEGAVEISPLGDLDF